MPLRQQGPEGDRGLDGALEGGTGLGDAEVQRVVALGGQLLVGRDHHHRVVVLDADLDVTEAVLLEQRRLPQRGFDECLRRGLAVFGHEPLVQRAGVDADADRDARRTGGLGDLADPAVEFLDVARVYPHRGTPGVDGGEDVLRLEVDVGYHRNLAVPGDLGQRVGVLLTRAGHPDDVTAGRGQFGDLLQGRVDVMSLGGAHRLHRDRIVAADPDVADHQLARGAPRGERRRRRLGHAQADTHWNSRIGLTRSAVTVSSM